MKKKNITTNILLVLVFLAGLSLVLYPTISNFINTKNQTKAIATYLEDLDNSDAEANARMLSQARGYNSELVSRENEYTLTPELQQKYNALLDLTGSGIMGYVEIPCIDCTIPVYHGTEDDTLQFAAGHVEWSSLPVGGESTHSVISGHRGLPTAELMTNIDRLRIGDRFYIYVLDEILEYRVDQIKVVLPDDTTYLQIEDGCDYVTLVTCTPYGINSHRLLVRGTRMTDSTPVSNTLFLTNEIEEISLVYVIPVALLIVAVVIAVFIGIKSLFRKKS